MSGNSSNERHGKAEEPTEARNLLDQLPAPECIPFLVDDIHVHICEPIRVTKILEVVKATADEWPFPKPIPQTMELHFAAFREAHVTLLLGLAKNDINGKNNMDNLRRVADELTEQLMLIVRLYVFQIDGPAEITSENDFFTVTNLWFRFLRGDLDRRCNSKCGNCFLCYLHEKTRQKLHKIFNVYRIIKKEWKRMKIYELIKSYAAAQ